MTLDGKVWGFVFFVFLILRTLQKLKGGKLVGFRNAAIHRTNLN